MLAHKFIGGNIEGGGNLLKKTVRLDIVKTRQAGGS
jgi:hypothetical protein